MSGRHRATREEYQARHLAAGVDAGQDRVPVGPATGVECYPIGHMDDARRDPRLYTGARS